MVKFPEESVWNQKPRNSKIKLIIIIIIIHGTEVFVKCAVALVLLSECYIVVVVELSTMWIVLVVIRLQRIYGSGSAPPALT
jgi:hypothetical protein